MFETRESLTEKLNTLEGTIEHSVSAFRETVADDAARKAGQVPMARSVCSDAPTRVP